MTAPTEPLKLTLEEAIVLIERDTQQRLVPIPDEDSDEPVALSWVLLGSFDDFGPFTSWVQASEHALGVPVVARDDAAELRAALREWAEATRAAEWFELDQTNAYGDDHIDAEDRVEAARRVLLALAATGLGMFRINKEAP